MEKRTLLMEENWGNTIGEHLAQETTMVGNTGHC